MDKQNISPSGAFRADYAIMIGGIVIGIAIIVLAVVFGGRGTPVSPLTEVPTDGRTGLEIGNAPVLGNPDAPHTIVEFFDFQCIACGAYFTQIKPEVVAKFVNTGKAKIIAKPLHFIDDYVDGGTESRRAAVASLCAQREGKFWDFYDAIFTAEQSEVQANIQNENSGNLTDSFFVDVAQRTGIAHDQFSQCVASTDYDGALQEYLQDALAALQGQVSTPSVFIDGQRLQNPFDVKEYEAIIK